jgi:LysR substrate binding domain-containing protein
MIHFGVPSSGGTDSTFAPARLTEGLIFVDDGHDASLTPADPADQTHVGHRSIHGLNDSGPAGRRLGRRSLIQIDVGRGRLAQRGEEIESHAMIDLVAAGAGFALVPSSVQEHQKKHIVCRRLDPAAPELDLSLAWARGGESPAINARLEMAFRLSGGRSPASVAKAEPTHTREARASQSCSRLGNTGRARTNGAHQPGATSSRLRAPQLTRYSVGRCIEPSVRIAAISPTDIAHRWRRNQTSSRYVVKVRAGMGKNNLFIRFWLISCT